MLCVVVPEVIPVRHDMSAEAHLDGFVRACHQPALCRRTPVVGDLGLPAVLNFLTEDAQLVAYRIARCRNAQRRHGIHVAGGKPAQAAVTETRVVFLLEDIACVSAEVGYRADERLGNAEVEGVFHQTSAHEKLH